MSHNNRRVLSSQWRLRVLPIPWRSCSQLLVEQGIMWSLTFLAFLEGHYFVKYPDFKEFMHRWLSWTSSILLSGNNAINNLHPYKGWLSFLRAIHTSILHAGCIGFGRPFARIWCCRTFFTMSSMLFSVSCACRLRKSSRSSNGGTSLFSRLERCQPLMVVGSSLSSVMAVSNVSNLSSSMQTSDFFSVTLF